MPSAGTPRSIFGPVHGPIDWNKRNGIESTPVWANINDEPGKPVTFEDEDVFRPAEEWNHLRYDFRSERNIGGTLYGSGFEGISALPKEDFFIDVARTLDSDGDGINNADDNVPAVFNPDQLDSDGDGIGDAGELISLVLSNTNVPDGAHVTGTVTLLLPAPAQGALIELFSDEPWMVDLPQYVVIPAGQRTATFPIPGDNRRTKIPRRSSSTHRMGWKWSKLVLTIGPAKTTADVSRRCRLLRIRWAWAGS